MLGQLSVLLCMVVALALAALQMFQQLGALGMIVVKVQSPAQKQIGESADDPKPNRCTRWGVSAKTPAQDTRLLSILEAVF